MSYVRGKSFFVSEDCLVVFEGSMRKTVFGDWRLRKSSSTVVVLQWGAATQAIIDMLSMAVDLQGPLKDGYRVAAGPETTMMLYGEKTLIMDHFLQADEHSTGYFDLPEAQFGGFVIPIRAVASPRPGELYRLVDANGYPVV